MSAEQHNDHCWITAEGSAWAIECIERTPDIWRFHLWRGYEPNLQRATLDKPANWDQQAYAESAAFWLGAGNA